MNSETSFNLAFAIYVFFVDLQQVVFELIKIVADKIDKRSISKKWHQNNLRRVQGKVGKAQSHCSAMTKGS